MPITHQHVMTGTDPLDPNDVGTTKWNEAHTLPSLAELGAAASSHTHVKANITDFAHTHPQSDITNLVTDLAGKSATGHTHSGLAPNAGTTGQVLKKNSNTDYDYAWAADSTGSAIAFREFSLVSGGAVAFTNLGAAFTEAGAQVSRTRVDLTGFTDFRILYLMSVAAVAGDVKLQYSTASNWASPVDLIQSDNPGANVLIESAWTTLPVGAKADVYLRVGMLNGNGSEDPAIRWFRLQVR